MLKIRSSKDTKIQIREICDVKNNKYKIYDFMKKDNLGRWRSVSTYFSLDDAINIYKNIQIEDLTTK